MQKHKAERTHSAKERRAEDRLSESETSECATWLNELIEFKLATGDIDVTSAFCHKSHVLRHHHGQSLNVHVHVTLLSPLFAIGGFLLVSRSMCELAEMITAARVSHHFLQKQVERGANLSILNIWADASSKEDNVNLHVRPLQPSCRWMRGQTSGQVPLFPPMFRSARRIVDCGMKLHRIIYNPRNLILDLGVIFAQVRLS